MKAKYAVLAAIAAVVLVVAGCATPGPTISEVSEGIDDFGGAEVTTSGTVQRGVPVAGTDVYIYQFSDGNQTVAVVSQDRPDHGTDRTVTARVVPFPGDMDESARGEIESYLAEAGVAETALEAATGQASGLVRTFSFANDARFFLLEES